MKYCYKCGAKLREDEICPQCGAEYKKKLDDAESRGLVQRLHKKSNSYRNYRDSGLSCIVIGSMLLIIGLLFYFLALKNTTDPANPNQKILYVDQSCSEFWTFVFGASIGGTVLLIGLVLAFTFAFLRRQVRHDVEEIRSNDSALTSPTPVIFVLWGKAIQHFFKEMAWRHKRNRLKKKENGAN